MMILPLWTEFWLLSLHAITQVNDVDLLRKLNQGAHPTSNITYIAQPTNIYVYELYMYNICKKLHWVFLWLDTNEST